MAQDIGHSDNGERKVIMVITKDVHTYSLSDCKAKNSKLRFLCIDRMKIFSDVQLGEEFVSPKLSYVLESILSFGRYRLYIFFTQHQWKQIKNPLGYPEREEQECHDGKY